MEQNNRSGEPTLEQRRTARDQAELHFSAHDARTETVNGEAASANAVNDAKTARLRALRLAKEEVDRTAAQIAKPGDEMPNAGAQTGKSPPTEAKRKGKK